MKWTPRKHGELRHRAGRRPPLGLKADRPPVTSAELEMTSSRCWWCPSDARPARQFPARERTSYRSGSLTHATSAPGTPRPCSRCRLRPRGRSRRPRPGATDQVREHAAHPAHSAPGTRAPSADRCFCKASVIVRLNAEGAAGPATGCPTEGRRWDRSIRRASGTRLATRVSVTCRRHALRDRRQLRHRRHHHGQPDPIPPRPRCKTFSWMPKRATTSPCGSP